MSDQTKMAMEDAVALAAALRAHPDDLEAALHAYEATPRPSVEKIQNSARPSLSWWEHFGRYHDAFEPWQFAFHFLTRSISGRKLARRDPEFVAATHKAWVAEAGREQLRTPLRLRAVSLPGRAVSVVRSGDGARVQGAGADYVPLLRTPPMGATPRPWGVWVEAPASERGLPAVPARLPADPHSGPDLVGVHGGSRLTRTLVAEEWRLAAGIPTLLVDDAMTQDEAETMVLSGRADLVGGTTRRRLALGGKRVRVTATSSRE